MERGRCPSLALADIRIEDGVMGFSTSLVVDTSSPSPVVLINHPPDTFGLHEVHSRVSQPPSPACLPALAALPSIRPCVGGCVAVVVPCLKEAMSWKQRTSRRQNSLIHSVTSRLEGKWKQGLASHHPRLQLNLLSLCPYFFALYAVRSALLPSS